MVKTLKSMGKKGGIPIVNEIVMTFLRVTPKPILLLIFVLLVTTIATFVIPAMLNMFGYECIAVDGDLKLYQVPMNNLAQKSLSDIKQGAREFAGFEDYKLPEDPFPDGDTRYLRVPAECFNEVQIAGETVVGYSSACVDCNASSWFRYSGSICLSDGYYDSTLITKYWIGTANFCYRCSPPNPYYYDHELCFNQDECFFHITDDDLADDIIQTEYGANYYYQNIIKLGGVERGQDATQFVNIQCDGVDEPQLYFFNIKVFDRTMWIYLLISGGLIYLASFWFRLVGL